MKKTLLILSILLFSCNTENKLEKIIDTYTSTTNKNDLIETNQYERNTNDYDLRGKVKSVSYSKYSAVAKFGEIKKSELISRYERKFNVKGKLEYDIDLNKDDSVTAYFENKYDKRGNLIELIYSDGILNFKNNKKGNVIMLGYEKPYLENKYDKRGNLIEVNIFNTPDSLLEKQIYKYNEKNKQIDFSEYDGEGNLERRIRFEYDNNGNLVQEIKYDADGSKYEVHKLEYNKKGNLYSYSRDNWFGKRTQLFFYGKYENLIKREEDYGDGISNDCKKIYIYTYDERENEIEMKKCGVVWWKNVYKYDNNGNTIEKIDYDYDSSTKRVSEKITSRVVTEYDDNNNWIKIINYINEFTPDIIEERKIEYYTTLESIFGVKDNNDLEKFLNNKQKYNLNGIEIINPEGYSYNEKKSNKIQLLFDKNDGSELRVMASKITDRAITSDAIKKVILSGNDIIKWKLLEPLKSSSGDLSELATISYGPNGLSGYRTGFKFNSLLVMIDSYAKTPREAFKALLETSINIDKNNLKYFTSEDIEKMTKKATKDIIQNYLKENPQLLPFSDN